jgi:hypothetical protein
LWLIGKATGGKWFLYKNLTADKPM